MEVLGDKVHKHGEHIPQHSFISHNHLYLSDSDTLVLTISLSAFKEYQQVSQNWIYRDNTYIASSTSDVSTLLICIALNL